MQTTPAALSLIKAFERFEPHAYWDKIGGLWTIGYGTTRYRDTGEAVQQFDEINQDDAEAETFWFVRDEVEPALTRHFGDIALQPGMRDALASKMYNLRNGTNPDRSFPKTKALIRSGASLAEIADEWVTADRGGGERVLGLYRRRIAEVLMIHGWSAEEAYSAVQKATLDSNWRDYVAQSDIHIFDDLEIPKRGTEEAEPVYDPTPDTPLTSEDAQYNALREAGGDMSFEEFQKLGGVVKRKDVIETPVFNPELPPKPMEESETHRGLSKKDSGRETVVIGTTATVITASLPVAKELTGFFKQFDMQTILTAGLFFGFACLAIGAWRWWRGNIIAYEGRQTGEQAKV